MSRFDISRIDDIIHGRLRLGIMAYLASAETATFNELLEKLDATKGNLSVQLRKLDEAGYVDVDRQIVGRKTETRARLTKTGRKAFGDYLDAMTALVNSGD